MNKIRSTKGITLVALVVTIIILLILAGVTINLTLGENGIFRTAQKAVQNYTDAQEKELADINEFSNIVNQTIQNVTGENSGTTTPTYEILASKAQPGDYVEYNGGNGYTGLWQVLYNDNTYGLQIISADTVKDSFTLGNDTDEAKAKSDYNDAVDILNAECEKYVNTSYATSGRCVGSNPLNPNDTITSKVTLKFTHNGTSESGCKVSDENYETDYEAMQKATNQNTSGIYNLGKTYWLASRSVYSATDKAYFGVRYISGSRGVPDYSSLCSVYPDKDSELASISVAIRPVITLKSGIQTNSGDGSENAPYKLVAQ